MLGSVGSVVPKRWILGIFALGLIAVMVATSANPWADASELPTEVSASASSPTSIQVNWTIADDSSTLPESGAIVDGYRVDCVPTPSGSTVSVDVTDRTIATQTVTVLADTTYVCSVFSSSSGTLPSTGVDALNPVTNLNEVTTPATDAVQLGSVVVAPASASIQVGGGAIFTASINSADSAGTAVTSETVNWTLTGSGGGTLSDPTGNSITYTATSAGNATLTATVSQAGTGIIESFEVSVTNFTPPASTSPPAGSDPTDIPTAPSLGGETQASTGVIMPSAGATLTIPQPASDDSDFQYATGATVSIPVNAAPSGTALAVVAELVPTSGGTSVAPTSVKQEDFVALPGGVNPVNAEPLTVQFVDSSGNEVTGVTLNALATISLTVPTADLFSANQDPQSVAIFKASDPSVGPWTELATTFTFVEGAYKFQAQTSNFSTFKLGSKTRDIPGAAGGAVLPSAGDVAPTNTQAIVLTTLGLLLIVGGGFYIRRQRKATAAG